MQGIKLKAVLAGRKVALLGAAAAVAGLSLLASVPADAAVGTSTGTLTFSQMTGPLTNGPTWSQTAACPSTANASAKLVIVLSDGVTEQSWSKVINGAATALTGQALNPVGETIGQLEGVASYTAGSTAELVVNCYSGASGTGTIVPFNDAFITFNTDNSTYTISDTAPAGPATPTVTLSATPNPVQEGTNVTLTATVTSNSTPVTAGSVQFENNGTAIGTPVALSASGVATTTTTFTSTGGLPLTAVFQTSNAALFNNATSNTVTENVSATNPNATGELITVQVAPSGSFSFTGTTNATAALSQSGNSATGAMVPVTVTDTRTGLAPQSGVPALVNGFSGYPGWSVVGQATDFTDPTAQPAGDIPVANFNWSPVAAPAAGSGTDYVLGGASTAGLGTARTLATAATGHGDGTFGLGAGLTLNIPTSAPAGAYASTLTLTADPLSNFGV
jgi:hypothetical protein